MYLFSKIQTTPASCVSRSVRDAVLVAASIMATAAFLTPQPSFAQEQTPTAPDNSGQNVHHGLTADQQSDHKSDMAITQKIRKAVLADKSLSTYAHNVKIITRHGRVTLKGPVASEDEKQAVVNKAETVVGSSDKVNDQLMVEHSSK